MRREEDRVYLCNKCHWEKVPFKRWQAGYFTCLPCGEEQAVQARASWCVAPMHKSNYMLFTDKRDLKGINNKGGLVK
jgi:ribosomal protein L37AE/L43A